MSKKQTNDQGYKSVMKEYDFYNNDNDDFEIIDEIPTNYINTTSNNNINNSLKNSEIEKQKGKLNKFIIKLFKIIFNSRNKLSEFDSIWMIIMIIIDNNILLIFFCMIIMMI